MKYIALFIILLSALGAICPNACSGHGTCSLDGSCTCFKQKGLGLNADSNSEGYTGTCPKAAQFSPQIFLIDTRGNDKHVAGNETDDTTDEPTTSRLLKEEGSFDNENITIITPATEIKEFKTYKLGGSLICYESKAKKRIVGYVDVLGYSEGNMIVMENFIDDESDIEKSYCIVKYVRKDLSLFSPITQDNSTRGWYSGDYTSLFKDYYGFDNAQNEYNVTLACIVSTEKGNDQYNEVVEYKAKMEMEDDNIEFDIPVEYPPEGNCFLLAGYNNSYVSIESSELFMNLLSKVDGRYYYGIKMEQDAVIDNIDSSAFEINDKGYANKVKIGLKAIQNLNEEDQSTILLALIPGNVITIIAYPSSGSFGSIVRYTVTIVSVTKRTKNERELFENERILQTDEYEYDIVYTPEIPITKGYTYTISTRTLAKNEKSVHQIVECSGAGTCNRQTGKCECFNGYDGAACQRMMLCPNNCNNNGKCVEFTKTLGSDNEFDIDKMKSFGFGTDTRTVKETTELRAKFFGCLCDPGHRGADCSLYECPSTQDPQKATNVKENPDLEYRDCSGRGICDYTTGICQCHDGFAGAACEMISSLQ